MKGGLVLALFAFDALKAAGASPGKRFVFLWTSDEEIGSGTSRAMIEKEARKSDAVLVLEPALGAEGKLKTVAQRCWARGNCWLPGGRRTPGSIRRMA